GEVPFLCPKILTAQGLRLLQNAHYSILKVMHEFSTSTFFPIVIDSPNQQDQDKENLQKMMELIFSEQPTDSQLILGVVDIGEVNFEGEIIELTDKYSLLQSAQYEDVYSEVQLHIDKSLQII
ncbi:hypothetical protein ACTHSJ_33780, partial [Paenibacillus cellulositrophicus]|uniref:hypothetical protein n=1 Tax=Paenibacillus cellulositrophicus TaxID=562959 RepID=UPI003F823DB1